MEERVTGKTYYKGKTFMPSVDFQVVDGVIMSHSVNHSGQERAKLFFPGDIAPSPITLYAYFPIDIQYFVISRKAVVDFCGAEYSKPAQIAEDIIDMTLPSLTDRILFSILRLNDKGFLPHINQTDLSIICGCSRVKVNQVVKSCSSIYVVGRRIIISDRGSFVDHCASRL